MFNQIPIFSPYFIIFLTKVFFLTATFLLVIFLVVVFKQVLSLNTIIDDGNDSLILKTASLILVILGVWLFLTALAIL